MNKKKPTRRCMGCNEAREKSELIRIVKPKEGMIEIDLSGKKSGRGADICPEVKWLDKVMKSKRLERVLEGQISPEVYENLRGAIVDQ